MIIPIFLTHAGCPHQCVFCNQKNITGRTGPLAPAAVPARIQDYLDKNRGTDPVQIAFYGGSFTALPIEVQRSYLTAVQPLIRSGRIQGIRISTRPDAIGPEVLDLLLTYHVLTVELGAQSMDNSVLRLSSRGHTAEDTLSAMELLRAGGFAIGLQLMPGLPGDTDARFRCTVAAAIKARPDFVRLYPALVIKDTPLADQYHSGFFAPLSLAQAVDWCRDALLGFESAGIGVIRIGLQPSEELERQGTIIAGPYHPAFRELVESSILLEMMRTALRCRHGASGSVIVQVRPRDLSAAIGQRRSNIEILKREFGLRDLRIVAGTASRGQREITLL